MNQENLIVLAKIIIAVETGGQIYGKGRYNDYTPPYKNTPNEHTITLGAAGNYGAEAKRLIQRIFDADPAAFRKLDVCSPTIESMLSKDWVALKWNPSSSQKNVLVSMIDSKIGHEQQDLMLAEKCKDMVEQCVRLYPKTDGDIKAQMMWAEIRHLGGTKPAQRIFDRCGDDFSLDNIMVSLVKDQNDSTSDNQVGDKIFWSRHLKCRQFIDQYAVEETQSPAPVEVKEEEKPMAVIIGSARSDEHGGSGWDGRAKAGDQKQTSTDDWKGEVSKQYYYVHSKGWVAIIAKSPEAREKIARNMEYACANKLIGYDQSQNRTLYNVVKNLGFDCSKVTIPCETDCAQLVRVCVRYAGINCDDFYTVTEKDVLSKTGAFDIYTSDKYCKSSDFLPRGTILVTRSKGHTVVTLTDGAKVSKEESSAPVVKPDVAPSPSAGGVETVKTFQKFLNNNYAQILKTSGVGLLKVDGVYGAKSRLAAVTVWKFMANKYYGSKLTLGNANFFESSKAVSAKMTDAEVAKHPTLGYLIQGVLAGKGWYSAKLDGVCGAKTKASIKNLQKAKGLTASGKMDANTWYILFN